MSDKRSIADEVQAFLDAGGERTRQVEVRGTNRLLMILRDMEAETVEKISQGMLEAMRKKGRRNRKEDS